MKFAAVLYTRVSTEEQVQGGVSLKDQEEKLLAYCKLQGLEPVHIIREEGVSAGKPLATRPGGQELLQLVKRGEVGHVIALKLDRLFRDAADALNVTKAWDNAGIALHLVDMGGQALNTASAMGRFFLSTMAGFAELERNLIAERTSAAMKFKKKHKEVYSPVPFGYDREGGNLLPNQEEQKAIKLIKKWRAAGRTLEAIAAELTKKGIKTKRGGKWYAGTVKYILENNLHDQEAAA
jgi:DNA invertase Pin-like site-specific DNA recombinase